MDGLGFVIRNRKDGLRDHAFEHGLGKRKAGFARHLGHRGIFVCLSRNQVEHRAAAFDGGQQLVVGFQVNCVLRQLAHDIVKQARVEDDASGFDHVGLGRGADPHGQVVAGQGERIGRGVNQQSFQQRHGAFSRDRAGGGTDQAEQGFFFTGEFHWAFFFLFGNLTKKQDRFLSS